MRIGCRGLAAGFVAAVCMALGGPALGNGKPGAEPLYVNAESSTAAAAARLTGQDQLDALALAKIPSGTWFTGGTPSEVQAGVATIVDRAAKANAVPLLVAYNIPFRDCALYSAGGAKDKAAYLDWIKAFAAGIGPNRAIVALEPDSLGVVPWNQDINGKLEGCQPAGLPRATAAADRFELIGQAVDILSALPNVQIYLDGTGSSWLSPGDAVSRLIKANVAKANGYFLNVSNYEGLDRVTKYAHWISDCYALVTLKQFDPKACGGQYYPANFADTASWALTDQGYDKAFADNGLKRDSGTQKHAIIDTSRNGRGSWAAPAGGYSDAQVWCNPPDRGLGPRPTLETGDLYVDGYLWIKVPGESDGQCYRGTSGPLDPERKMADPAAGQWFVEQVRELVKFASPPFSVPKAAE